MSLLDLVHKSVFIKFADAAKNQFNLETTHAFRLTAVDAMGFLRIQELKPAAQAGHDAASEPYWINKDLVREIHEFDPASRKGTSSENGQNAKASAQAPIEPVRRDLAPKAAKAKLSLKQKSAMKQKPSLN
jgi:hypothetical protein